MKKNKRNKKKSLGLLIFGLTIFTIIVAVSIIPVFQNIQYGLDLQGGFEVLYQVDPLDEDDKVTDDMVNATYKTLLKRVDVLGVSEPEISIEGSNKIRVKLAGVTTPDEARTMLSTNANLTFRDTKDNLLMNSDVLESAGAKKGRNDNGLPVVSLSVKDKDKFYEVTSEISQSDDKTIVIWLDFDRDEDSFSTESENCGALSDSKCLSAATVSQGFASDVIIEGNFTDEEVDELVDLINSGSLPTKLTEISSRTVDASFGSDALNKTLISGAIGVLLIMILMIAIYKIAGVVSSISILIYTFLVFLVFYLIGGVLTLPGLAAVVLGIGMAVDSSVITFERIKEELKKGRALNYAFQMGNKNSLGTIMDANITTMIVAIILFIFGESSVKGFATMLIINIIVTVFTMVFLNRIILKKFVNTGKYDNKLHKLLGIKESDIGTIKKPNIEPNIKFNFVKNKLKYFMLSLIILIIGAIFIVQSGLNLGIDYKGGSTLTINVDKEGQLEDIKKDIESYDYKLSEIDYVNNDEKQIFAKIDDTLTKEQVKQITDTLEDKYEAQTDVGVVSNMVKKELTKNAIISVVLAIIGIILYVTIRFTFNYGFSAVVALIHDILIIIAIFGIFKLEVSIMFIAALLAILGYSINDTIVSFDRIRENIKEHGTIKSYNELSEIVNFSLRQTFMRSLITTITTMIPVIMLSLFGANSIITFNIAMLIGLISGTYSSIFLAAQLWLILEKKNIGKEQKKRFFEVEDDELDEKTI